MKPITDGQTRDLIAIHDLASQPPVIHPNDFVRFPCDIQRQRDMNPRWALKYQLTTSGITPGAWITLVHFWLTLEWTREHLPMHDRGKILDFIHQVVLTNFPKIYLPDRNNGNPLPWTMLMSEISTQAESGNTGLFLIDAPSDSFSKLEQLGFTPVDNTTTAAPMRYMVKVGITLGIAQDASRDIKQYWVPEQTTIAEIQYKLTSIEYCELGHIYNFCQALTLTLISSRRMADGMACNNTDSIFDCLKLKYGNDIPQGVTRDFAVAGTQKLRKELLEALIDNITSEDSPDEKSQKIRLLSNQASSWKHLLPTSDKLKQLTSTWSQDNKSILAQCMQQAEHRLGYTKHRNYATRFYQWTQDSPRLTGRAQWVQDNGPGAGPG